MKLENSFEVPAPPDRAWDFMMDVERVAPCMPGAEITEQVDGRTWKGKVSIKLGPVSLAFAGTLVREEVDEGARRVVMNAKGTETRGKGMATATVTSRLEPASDGGTRVEVVTDLQISGAAAQYGRGMIGDVSQRFTQEFADCLGSRLRASGAEADAGAAGTAADAPRPGGAATGPPGAAGSGAGGDSGRSGPGAAAGSPRSGAKAPAEGARPISGIRLGAWALWRAFRRGVGRLFGGKSSG